MKLFEAKAPADSYVVTVRNGERVSGGDASPEQAAGKPRAGDIDLEALEKLGLVMKLPGPDPGPG